MGTMTKEMGAIKRDKGVLKLVHPGRYVETHTQPITAAEVMKRNPRHCITRPDVFEYPWIVVRPESILNLGKVFFIVPNHTIYCLLKASGKASLQQNQSPKNLDHHNLKQPSPFSPLQSPPGMTPKHQNHQRRSKKQFQTMPRARVSPREQDCRDDRRKHYQVKCWPRVSSVKRKKTRQEIEHQFSLDSKSEIRSSRAEEHQLNANRINASLPKNLDGEVNFCRQLTLLKSSLRKPDSVRKLLGLRVTFDLPNKDDEKPRRVTESEESADSLIC